MKFICITLFMLSSQWCTAQVKDTTLLQEVVVSGIQESKTTETALNLESYSLEQLSAKSPYNLSDALAGIPGISQMKTGNAISKPVIRGLYGNRILVLLSGLRFDNQQFQDEHGLGLSQIGIDRVEVIKGPASILYGTDAIGGIINVIEEVPHQPGKAWDINTRLFSNTAGTLTDIGYASVKNNKWWRIRAGAESHSDYADGNNQRVLNSRNKGYYLKAGYGFSKKYWEQNNSYNFSYSQFGFILDSLSGSTVPDERLTRKMSGPHHNVMLHILSSQNTFRLKSSVLKLNAGVQSNRRKEDEGGGEISLDMHLLSLLQNAKWEKKLARNLQFIANQQFTFEDNTNFGKRILIPDAHMLEGNLSGFVHYTLSKLTLEAGAGYNYKRIRTFKTGILNLGSTDTPDTTMSPFTTGRSSANVMVGFSYTPVPWLNVKANAATGNRAGNLAELSSNGLHEGIYRVEIGTPNLEMEENINTDMTVEVNSKHVFLSVSGYYNHFNNYIYLTATGEPAWFGFPRYRYTQQDATLYGGEFILSGNIGNHVQLRGTFTATRGILDAGGNLPFIPANRTTTSFRYIKDLAKGKGLYVEPELEYVLRQDRPALFETATGDYALIHINTGITTSIKKHDIKWNLSCRNVLNKAYTDHLSRLKYYGLNNEGINFILSVSTTLR